MTKKSNRNRDVVIDLVVIDLLRLETERSKKLDHMLEDIVGFAREVRRLDAFLKTEDFRGQKVMVRNTNYNTKRDYPWMKGTIINASGANYVIELDDPERARLDPVITVSIEYIKFSMSKGMKK